MHFAKIAIIVQTRTSDDWTVQMSQAICDSRRYLRFIFFLIFTTNFLIVSFIGRPYIVVVSFVVVFLCSLYAFFCFDYYIVFAFFVYNVIR